MVEYQLPKLRGRVRFPLSAPFFLPKNPQATCTVLAAQAARTVQAALVMLSKLMNYQISANIFCLFVGKIKAGMVKPFFVCKFTFRLQPAMLPVVFVVRMLSPPAFEHRSPMKQPHFVSILCFFASIAFHVNP